MRRALIAADPPIELLLRRSERARRFTLRVGGGGAPVTLTLPARAREAEALAFARDRIDWIRSALAALPERRPVRPGVRLPVEGREVEIVAAPVRGVRAEPGAILVPPGPGAGRRVAAHLRLLARERLLAAAGAHAAALGRGFGRLVLRDPRGRWGSCSATGTLMFSWRLVMAPPEVLDYVAAHEVAHLAEMNHSPRFWAVVARLLPDHAPRRAWLRAHGPALQSWDFEG